MSLPHHTADERPLDPQERAAMNRLIEEIRGTAKPSYPHGRVSGDDLGETAFAVADDPEHKIIRIQFTKPITWLGLDVQTAEKLTTLLLEKLRELRS